MAFLPLEGVQEAMRETVSQKNQESNLKSLNYPKWGQGNPDLLKEISSFLERQTKNDDLGSIPTAGDIVTLCKEIDMSITHGISHGLDILFTAQIKPGDIVFMDL